MINPPSRSADQLRSAMEWHIQSVYTDPEFIEDVMKNLPIEKHPSANTILAKKYSIRPYDVHYFRMSQILHLPQVPYSKYQLIPDPNSGKLQLTLDPLISKAEYLEAWEMISSLQKALYKMKPSKRKPPENPSLIYAVYKARKSLTFPEIFYLYENGALPMYSGSKSQFSTVEALERYYDKYKPAT